MKMISSISENKVIAVFLQAELDSNRWKKEIENLLVKQNLSNEVIFNPDLHNSDENKSRKKILEDLRGYGRNKDLFESFPKKIKWYRLIINKDELSQVLYMDYSYWNELSSDTRLPSKAAQTILSGKEIFGEDNSQFLVAAEKLRRGVSFPTMIFMGKDVGSKLVVLEGHLRMTAYYLAPEMIPQEIEVIVGFSPTIKDWGGY